MKCDLGDVKKITGRLSNDGTGLYLKVPTVWSSQKAVDDINSQLPIGDIDNKVQQDQTAFLTSIKPSDDDQHYTLQHYKFPKGIECTNVYFNDVDEGGDKKTPVDDRTLRKRSVIRAKTMKTVTCVCHHNMCDEHGRPRTCSKCSMALNYDVKKYDAFVMFVMDNNGTGNLLNKDKKDMEDALNNFANLGLDDADLEG
jgi:hypothetical protein